MCVIFCIGTPMMSLVFLALKMIDRPDGTSVWWEYSHCIFCTRGIHISWIERQNSTFESISGLKMLSVCLHVTLLQIYINIYTF